MRIRKTIFGRSKTYRPNTYIGGIGDTINTPNLLATKLGIAVSRIKSFTVVKNEIRCQITANFTTMATPYRIPNTITHLIDTTGYIKSLSQIQQFTSTPNIKIVELPGVTYLKGSVCYGNSTIRVLYVPIATNIGEYDSSNVFVGIGGRTRSFEAITSGFILYCNPSLATADAGNSIPDINTIISRGGIVRYVLNFNKPSNIYDLSGTILTSTSIRLNFTAPTSSNGIDYYQVWIDGYFKQNITASGQNIIGLVSGTQYKIELRPIDIFYNKSTSNIINITTS